MQVRIAVQRESDETPRPPIVGGLSVTVPIGAQLRTLGSCVGLSLSEVMECRLFVFPSETRESEIFSGSSLEEFNVTVGAVLLLAHGSHCAPRRESLHSTVANEEVSLDEVVGGIYPPIGLLAERDAIFRQIEAVGGAPNDLPHSEPMAGDQTDSGSKNNERLMHRLKSVEKCLGSCSFAVKCDIRNLAGNAVFQTPLPPEDPELAVEMERLRTIGDMRLFLVENGLTTSDCPQNVSLSSPHFVAELPNETPLALLCHGRELQLLAVESGQDLSSLQTLPQVRVGSEPTDAVSPLRKSCYTSAGHIAMIEWTEFPVVAFSYLTGDHSSHTIDFSRYRDWAPQAPAVAFTSAEDTTFSFSFCWRDCIFYWVSRRLWRVNVVEWTAVPCSIHMGGDSMSGFPATMYQDHGFFIGSCRALLYNILEDRWRTLYLLGRIRVMRSIGWPFHFRDGKVYIGSDGETFYELDISQTLETGTIPVNPLNVPVPRPGLQGNCCSYSHFDDDCFLISCWSVSGYHEIFQFNTFHNQFLPLGRMGPGANEYVPMFTRKHRICVGLEGEDHQTLYNTLDLSGVGLLHNNTVLCRMDGSVWVGEFDGFQFRCGIRFFANGDVEYGSFERNGQRLDMYQLFSGLRRTVSSEGLCVLEEVGSEDAENLQEESGNNN